MKLSAVLVKVAMGEKLSPVELELLKQNAETLDAALEMYKSMSKVPGEIAIEHLRLGASGITADKNILQPFNATKLYDVSDTTITNATFTEVTFNYNAYGNSQAFKLGSDNKKVHIQTKAKALFCTMTHAWASGTGFRRVDFQYYTVTGSLIGTALFSIVPAATGGENWFTATRIADLPDNTDYIMMRVHQNSGGDLKLVYAAIDLHVI